MVTQAWVALRTQATQRALAQETRKAEASREARASQLELSRWCLELSAALTNYDERVLVLARRPLELEAQLAIYADTTLRDALTRVDTTLAVAKHECCDGLRAIAQVRVDKEQAIEDLDFELAAAYRDKEKALMSNLTLLKSAREQRDLVTAALAPA